MSPLVLLSIRLLNRLVIAALLLACASVFAQSVSLQGVLGNSALLVVGGAAPRSVPVGSTYQGVTVLQLVGDQAIVEIGGRRFTLRVGDTPGSVGGSGDGRRIVLKAGPGGHYLVQGSINGHATMFVVDTGATLISMGAADAQRLGLNYRAGQQGYSNTANGVTPVWRVKLSSVRVGDVELYDIDALVSPQPMPFVLLGNNFLNRFDMKRDHNQMVLERRY